MSKCDRRQFLRLTAVSTVSAVGASYLPSNGLAAAEPRRSQVPRGYFLVQDVATYNTSRFGSINGG